MFLQVFPSWELIAHFIIIIKGNSFEGYFIVDSLDHISDQNLGDQSVFWSKKCTLFILDGTIDLNTSYFLAYGDCKIRAIFTNSLLNYLFDIISWKYI